MMERDSLILGLAAILLPVLTYFAGVRRGRRERTEDRDHQVRDVLDQRLHAKHEQLVAEYVDMARRHYASGPHGLAVLGLHVLETDARIRDALREMEARTAHDPWSGGADAVKDVDLVKFFKYVADNRVKFHKETVRQVADAVRGS